MDKFEKYWLEDSFNIYMCLPHAMYQAIKDIARLAFKAGFADGIIETLEKEDSNSDEDW